MKKYYLLFGFIITLFALEVEHNYASYGKIHLSTVTTNDPISNSTYLINDSYSNNSITIGYTNNASNFEITRYSYNGTSLGSITYDFNGTDTLSAIDIDSSNAIYAVGSVDNANSTHKQVGIVKFNSNNSTLYAHNDVLQYLGVDYDKYPQAIDIDSSGNAYIAGYFTSNATSAALLMKYNSSGIIDENFIYNLTSNSTPTFYTDFQLLACKVSSDNSRVYIAGSLTSTYGLFGSIYSNGTIEQQVFPILFPYENKIFDIQTQSNGSLLVVGKGLRAGGVTQGFVQRYSSSGVLDSSFGSSGSVMLDNGTTTTTFIPISLIVNSDDTFYVSGQIKVGTQSDLFITKYSANGVIDTTFGTNGYYIYDISGNNANDYGGKLTSDGNNALFLAGQTLNGSYLDTYVTKLFEPTFNTITLYNGWNYISLSSDFKACNETLKATDSTCQSTYDLAKLFSYNTNSHIKYIANYDSSNKTWSYYNKNSSNTTYSFTTSVGNLTYVDMTDGIALKSDAQTTLSIPNFPIYNDPSSQYIATLNKGWNLLGGANINISVDEIRQAIINNGKSMKYILLFRNNLWMVYAPYNDSEVDSSLTRLQYVFANESYWIFIE